MMTDESREVIYRLNNNRKAAREKLGGDAEQAKHDLHPRTLMQRWKHKKQVQLAQFTDSGKQSLAKNAPLIGLAGAAILLFAARRPISHAIEQLRHKAKDRKS
jgi:hypothetical protein